MREPRRRNGDNAASTGSEEPTGAAYVKITTMRDGPSLMVSVPERETSQLLKVTELICGIGGIVIGPFAMAKALEMADPGMPWQAQVSLFTLAALLPMACYWLTVRRRRRRRRG
ncbi:hypothetical protein GCM10027168_55960 [Streptomyces capparidis]